MELSNRYALKNIYLQILLIVLCALIVYGNTLYNGFVYDDNAQILNNPWITDVKNVPDIFSHDANIVQSGYTSNYYRPVMHLIYMLNYYVFNGLKPWAFHLFNVLFHIGVAILVFFTTSLLVREEIPATPRQFFSIPLLSTLIFTVHPINTEVVAWVACMPELSFTFFCLLSLYCHIRSSDYLDLSHFWSLAFFSIAIFCKETALTILPIFVIYDYMYRTDKYNLRHYIIRYVPFVMVVGVYLILRYNALGGIAPSNRHLELNTFEVIINVLPLFIQYIEKLLFPIYLKAFYVLHPIHSIIDQTWLLSLVAVIAFISIGLILYKKNKTAFFGLVIITIPLLPVMYIRGLGESTFAERYLYLPSIGFSLVVGTLFNSAITHNNKLRIPLYILLIFVLALYSIGTINRNKIWHDELTLWTDTIQNSSDSCVVHYNLGNALLNTGDLDAAVKEFKKALTINPIYPDAHYTLGAAFSRQGDLDAAIKEYREALAINPNYADAHISIGNDLSRKGDLDAAIKEYIEAIGIRPNDELAHFNLGNALLRKGDLETAINEYKETLAINPTNVEAQKNLNIALGSSR